MLPFQVCKADILKYLGLEEIVPAAGDLETSKEVVFCEVFADKVEDERDIKDGEREGGSCGSEEHVEEWKKSNENGRGG